MVNVTKKSLSKENEYHGSINIYLSFISGWKDIGKYTEGQVDGIYTDKGG